MKEFVSPTDEDVYTTRDLYEATSLHASGSPLKRVDRDDNGVCYFVFPDSVACEDTILKYRNGLLEVNAKNFVGSMRMLKDVIHGDARRR